MMKFLKTVGLLCLAGTAITQAVPVSEVKAELAARSFYARTVGSVTDSFRLEVEKRDNAGTPLWYAFNAGGNRGFVVIAADDAADPIIGYSGEGSFSAPEEGSNIGYFMDGHADGIRELRSGSRAVREVNPEWELLSVMPTNEEVAQPSRSRAAGAPLSTALWNQGTYYNTLCPMDGSTRSWTGCGATAMSIIMKYWNYPDHGTGRESYYWDTLVLSADFSAATYDWSTMPSSNLTAPNGEVAKIMYHTGVAINASYGAEATGAFVTKMDDPVCAEAAYVKYFGYNPYTIKGWIWGSDTTGWMNILKAEIDAGRPVQCAGGGHTWVGSGYDASNRVYMNWGWGGSNNGYFALNSMGQYSSGLRMIAGIQPWTHPSVDAAIAVTGPSTGANTGGFTPVVTLTNYGSSTLTSAAITWSLDGGSSQQVNWTGSLAQGNSEQIVLSSVTPAAGSHTLSVAVSVSGDGEPVNDTASNSFTVTEKVVVTLPQNYTFESGIPSGWSQPNGATKWLTNGNAISWPSKYIYTFTGTPGLPKRQLTTCTYDIAGIIPKGFAFDLHGNKEGLDSLIIYGSVDGGMTWDPIYEKGEFDLQTSQTQYHGYYSPTSADWRRDSVDISHFAGNSELMFMFEVAPRGGDAVVIDNLSITAGGTVTTYTITATANGTGSISPDGAKQIASGGSQNYLFFPDSGSVLDSVKVNNQLVSVSGSSYTISNVTADRTIIAWFSKSSIIAIDTTNLSVNLIEHGSWSGDADSYGSSVSLDTSLVSDNFLMGAITTASGDSAWASVTGWYDIPFSNSTLFKVTYQADKAIRIVLNQEALSNEGIAYGVELPASANDTTVYLPISEFVQPNWIDSATQKADLVLDSVSSISFESVEQGGITMFSLSALQATNYEVGAVSLNSSVVHTPSLALNGISRSAIHLSVPSDGMYRITAFALNGRILFDRSVSLNAGSAFIPAINLPASICIVTVEGAGVRGVFKSIVQ